MNLLVIAGGRSAERDVSCISAAAIIRNADKKRHKISLVHIDRQGRWLLESRPLSFANNPKPWLYKFKGRRLSIELGSKVWLKGIPVDVVFPALHGPMGEDGTIQGLFELAQVPYVGCDVLGSAVGMDKVLSKRLAAQAGLPQLPYAVLTRPDDLRAVRGLKYPVFVKPSRLGSSVGVYKVKRAAGLAAAVRNSFRFDTTVVVEQGIDPREIECAVLGGGSDIKASGVGEIRANAEFYSYEAKYLDPDGARIMVRAELNRAQRETVRALAVRAFKALACYGCARVDFLMDKKTGKLWFNEVNTLPGFTSLSLYPRLWGEAGLPFPKLIDKLIALALARHKARARLSVKP